MSQVLPVVRYLIVCDDVVIDPANNHRVSIIGLIGKLRSAEVPPFPILQRELCIFAQLTGCRGPAQGRIEIRNADTNDLVFRTKSHTMQFTNDPLDIQGVTFRIHGCLFQEAGLYWVHFWYNEEAIAQQPLIWK